LFLQAFSFSNTVIRSTGRSMEKPCSIASDKLAVTTIPGKGRAVLAHSPISAGELLAVWGGAAITLAQAYALPRHERAQCLQVEDDVVIWTAHSKQSIADWINHSCNPNSGMLGQICLIAMRDIRPREEICFDYAMCGGCDLDEFKCACNHSECRGYVSGKDWQRRDLQVKYHGYFSPFLQRRIRAQLSPSLQETPSTSDVPLRTHMQPSPASHSQLIDFQL
jgi:uncharacterized protein